MRMFYRYLTILALLSPVLSFGQCLTHSEVEKVLDERDIESISEIVKDSARCRYSDSLLGSALHEIGVQHYLDNQLNKAIVATQLALDYRLRSLPPDAVKLGKSNHNLGVFYRQQYAFKKAIPFFRTAIDVYLRTNSYRAIGSSRELAACYGELGEYGLAQNSLRQAIQLAYDMQKEAFLAECYVDLGKLLLQQRQYRPAIDTLMLADSAFRQFDLRSDPYLMRSHAACLHNLAFAWDELNSHARAKNYYEASKQKALALGDTSLLIKNQINIGIVNRKLKQYGMAMSNFKQAMQVLDHWQDSRLRAICYDNIGDIYFDQQAFSKAHWYYHLAIHTLLPELPPDAKDQLPRSDQLGQVAQPYDLLVYLMDKAKAWRALYEEERDKAQLQKALEAYRLADRVHDIMRLQQLSQEARHYWRSEAKTLYAKALEVAYLLQEEAAAFYFFEKSKSILLLEALLVQDVQNLLPEEIAEQEREFQKQINDLLLELEYAEGEELKKKQAALLSARQGYRDLLDRMSHQYPAYYNLRYASGMLTLSDALARLKGPEVHMIHYFTGPDYIYALRISQNGSFFYRLKKEDQFKELLQQLLAYFQNRSLIAEDPAGYAEVAKSLAHLLYTPLWGVGELPRDAEVIIMPDEVLSFIPFEALMLPNESAGLQVKNSLLFHQMIQYAYSATVLQYQQGRAEHLSGAGSVAFFAPFTEPQTGYPILPFSQQVMASVQRKFSGHYQSGMDAGWQAFSRYAPNARILHFSTHGTSGSATSSPAIVLADTLLRLPQLYNLSLSCQLAVLSACETGVGAVQEGEGVINLGRGFAYAGTSGLATSLWKVDDEATAQLMERFYHHLSKGENPAHALRNAKLDYLSLPGLRAVKTTPYFWSSLVFWGYDAPVRLDRKGPYWWWYALGGLMVLILVLFLYRRITTN